MTDLTSLRTPHPFLVLLDSIETLSSWDVTIHRASNEQIREPIIVTDKAVQLAQRRRAFRLT